MNMTVSCEPIGVIRSAHTNLRKTPIQPVSAEKFRGHIKPYTARFDRIGTSRNGRQDEVAEQTAWHRGRCL